ncbi:MAG: hypothetical protein IJS59_00280 [Bacteroidaceae bacterium]|nr:hypothetical protein [Bacteroidaceae bacterium]
MKKFVSLITLTVVSIAAAFGMSYSEARQQALFLTDKMAYELNLNQQQYEDCYEINLDYLMGVVTPDDVYGPMLDYRNSDLRHILYDWQYDLFRAADYFLRPLRWYAGAWAYPIYRIYDATRFFFGRPAIYASYHGGHSRYYYSHGYYVARRPHYWHGGMRGHDIGPSRPHDPRGYHIGGSHTRPGYRIEGSRHGGYGQQPRSGGRSGYTVGHGNGGTYSHNYDGNHGGGSSHNGYGSGSRTDRSGYGSHGGRSGGSGYSHPSSTRTMGGGSSASGRGSATSHGSASSHEGSSHGGGRSGTARGGR